MRGESSSACSLRSHHLLQLQSILQKISAEQDCSKVHLQKKEHLRDQREDAEELSILQVTLTALPLERLRTSANCAKNSLIKKNLIHEDKNKIHIFIIKRKVALLSGHKYYPTWLISFHTCPIQNSTVEK